MCDGLTNITVLHKDAADWLLARQQVQSTGPPAPEWTRASEGAHTQKHTLSFRNPILHALQVEMHLGPQPPSLQTALSLD